MTHAMKTVDVHAAAKLMQQGALMIDVREPGEYAAQRIPGTQNIPLSRLEISTLPLGPGQAVVFFCASGNRTSVNAARLHAKAGGAKAHLMQGGISAWGRAGLPVESGRADNDDRPGFFSRIFAR